jgi:potassium/hydrogen antiporter
LIIGAGSGAGDAETVVKAGDLGLVLFVGAVVVIAAIVAARVAHGVGLPSLLVFLGLGLVLSEVRLGVRFDNAGLAQALGLSALVLILAEGGLTTSWSHARAAAPAALALATVGVAVSALAIAVAGHWLLSLTWRNAVLLGAVLAPTDAAAVFSVLRKLPLPPRAVRDAGRGVGAQRRACRARGDPPQHAGHVPALAALLAGIV